MGKVGQAATTKSSKTNWQKINQAYLEVQDLSKVSTSNSNTELISQAETDFKSWSAMAVQDLTADIVSKAEEYLNNIRQAVGKAGITSVVNGVRIFVDSDQHLKGIADQLYTTHETSSASLVSFRSRWRQLLSLAEKTVPTYSDLVKAKELSEQCQKSLREIVREKQTLHQTTQKNGELQQIEALDIDISKRLSAAPKPGDSHYRSTQFNTAIATIRGELQKLPKSEQTALVTAQALHARAIALIEISSTINIARSFADTKGWDIKVEPDVKDHEYPARFTRALNELLGLEKALAELENSSSLTKILKEVSFTTSLINSIIRDNGGMPVKAETTEADSAKPVSRQIDDLYEDLLTQAKAGPKEFRGIRSAAYLAVADKETQQGKFAELMSQLLKLKETAKVTIEPEAQAPLVARAELHHAEALEIISEATKQEITKVYESASQRALLVSPQLSLDADPRLEGAAYQGVYADLARLQALTKKTSADLSGDDLNQATETAKQLEAQLSNVGRVVRLSQSYNAARESALVAWPDIDTPPAVPLISGPRAVTQATLQSLRDVTLPAALKGQVSNQLLAEGMDQVNRIQLATTNKDIIASVTETLDDAITKAKALWDDISVTNSHAETKSAKGVIERYLASLYNLKQSAWKPNPKANLIKIADIISKQFNFAIEQAPHVIAMEQARDSIRDRMAQVYPRAEGALSEAQLNLDSCLQGIETSINSALRSMAEGSVSEGSSSAEKLNKEVQWVSSRADLYFTPDAMAREFQALYISAWSLARHYHPNIGTGIRGSETPAAQVAQDLHVLDGLAERLKTAIAEGEGPEFKVLELMIKTAHEAISEIQKVSDPNGELDWNKVSPVADEVLVNIFNELPDVLKLPDADLKS